MYIFIFIFICLCIFVFISIFIFILVSYVSMIFYIYLFNLIYLFIIDLYTNGIRIHIYVCVWMIYLDALLFRWSHLFHRHHHHQHHHRARGRHSIKGTELLDVPRFPLANIKKKLRCCDPCRFSVSTLNRTTKQLCNAVKPVKR